MASNSKRRLIARELLAEWISKLFLCPPGSPTGRELDVVLSEVRSIRAIRVLEPRDWRVVVLTNVATASDVDRKAEDFSDLNALFDDYLTIIRER